MAELNTEPQWAGLTLSSLCELMPRPIVMDGMFRDHFVNHFHQAGKIEEPDLRELLWQDHPRTDILIEVIQLWNPLVTEKRPGVVIKRNVYRNHKVGLGNRRQLQAGDEFGHAHYETFWVGSHSLFCLGGTGAQANLLATEVQRELTQWASALRVSMGLQQLDVMEVGGISLVEEAHDTFVVPVVVTYAYSERWTVRKQAPVLRRLSLSRLLGE